MDPLELVRQNNAWSAEQAQKQMDFQREMSNTAHQREIEDLKAAGLNPVLSAKLGGASTPNGAMAQPDTSGTSAIINMMMSAMHTAGSAAAAAANATKKTSNFEVNGTITDSELTQFQKVINGLPLPRWLKQGMATGAGYLANWYNQQGVDPKAAVQQAADTVVTSAKGASVDSEKQVTSSKAGSEISLENFDKWHAGKFGVQKYQGEKLLDPWKTYKAGHPVYYVIGANGKRIYLDA